MPYYPQRYIFLAVGVPLKNSAPAVMERLSMAITAIII